MTGDQDISAYIEMHQGEPKVFSGRNSDDEFHQTMAEGWIPIGYSSFNAGSADQSLALAHARKIGAAMVTLSSSYTGTVSGAAPLSLPNTTTTYHSGSVSGYGGYATYGGTSTTHGTTTTYIPYAIDRYDYIATYWVKRRDEGWGILCNELTIDQRKEAGTNKGVFVTNVAKNGSAYWADLLPGDILIAINDHEIRSCEAYDAVAASVTGTTANVRLLRGGEERSITFFVEPFS
jgi:serine protease Do